MKPYRSSILAIILAIVLLSATISQHRPQQQLLSRPELPPSGMQTALVTAITDSFLYEDKYITYQMPEGYAITGQTPNLYTMAYGHKFKVSFLDTGIAYFTLQNPNGHTAKKTIHIRKQYPATTQPAINARNRNIGRTLLEVPLLQNGQAVQSLRNISFPALILFGWRECPVTAQLVEDFSTYTDSLPAGVHYYYIVSNEVRYIRDTIHIATKGIKLSKKRTGVNTVFRHAIFQNNIYTLPSTHIHDIFYTSPTLVFVNAQGIVHDIHIGYPNKNPHRSMAFYDILDKLEVIQQDKDSR